jgi:hypothetical protein
MEQRETFGHLPTTTVQVHGIWPFSGEIDILEGSGQQSEVVCGVHFGGPWSHRANLATRTNCPTPQGKCVPCGSGAFHTWSFLWRVDYVAGLPKATMTWLLDGIEVKRLRSHEWWTNVQVCSHPEFTVMRMSSFTLRSAPCVGILSRSAACAPPLLLHRCRLTDTVHSPAALLISAAFLSIAAPSSQCRLAGQ